MHSPKWSGTGISWNTLHCDCPRCFHIVNLPSYCISLWLLYGGNLEFSYIESRMIYFFCIAQWLVIILNIVGTIALLSITRPYRYCEHVISLLPLVEISTKYWEWARVRRSGTSRRLTGNWRSSYILTETKTTRKRRTNLQTWAQPTRWVLLCRHGRYCCRGRQQDNKTRRTTLYLHLCRVAIVRFCLRFAPMSSEAARSLWLANCDVWLHPICWHAAQQHLA